MIYEWDHSKARANYRKHGVRFDEAVTVFDDPLAAIFEDGDHSNVESREIVVGHSIRQRLVMVSFTERGDGRIRIISARSATKREARAHENYTGN